MRAGGLFLHDLEPYLSQTEHINIDLYGSLALTGKGHQTDQAVLLGLAGFAPATVVVEDIPGFMAGVRENKLLPLAGGEKNIPFQIDDDIIFHQSSMPLHENGMSITATGAGKTVLRKTYYSIGGGTVVEEENFGRAEAAEEKSLPYPFASADDLLHQCREHGLSISAVAMENELALHDRDYVAAYCLCIWKIMEECIKRGTNSEGVLPGPMRVQRRAPALYRKLLSQTMSSDPLLVMDWVSMFALAVGEENAAGSRVVTAPTNGACGIIPAVLAYYNRFINPLDNDVLQRFFLTAGAVGLLYRMNASIAGAEVGCQGEVGVACSMAAAGLTELMGGSPLQVCAAAEIGMEHNLGLTCDPVGGQVQIPCIERNAINAIKAITSSRMALERISRPAVSLDNVIEAMLRTGKDMNAKYRETSQGGLAALPRFTC
jgi:L-serine dehydratase